MLLHRETATKTSEYSRIFSHFLLISFVHRLANSPHRSVITYALRTSPSPFGVLTYLSTPHRRYGHNLRDFFFLEKVLNAVARFDCHGLSGFYKTCLNEQGTQLESDLAR